MAAPWTSPGIVDTLEPHFSDTFKCLWADATKVAVCSIFGISYRLTVYRVEKEIEFADVESEANP